MSSSSDLFARAQQLIPGGVNSPVRAFRSVGGAPFFTKSAQGATLTTADGRELIDFVCTWGPAIHGHNHPRIKAAIAAALDKGTSFGTPNPYEVEMAELIVDFFPSIQKVRMCNSGTEATMSAIRLARGFTKRDKIIKFDGCYHGHADALLVKAGSGANSYTLVKSIAEELRGLAVEYNVALVTATQTTRSGLSSSDIDMADTSESVGLPFTADLMYAVITNEELEKSGYLKIKQLKNRYDEIGRMRSFLIGVERAKMRIFDVDVQDPTGAPATTTPSSPKDLFGAAASMTGEMMERLKSFK